MAERAAAEKKVHRRRTVLIITIAAVLAILATIFVLRYALSKIESHTVPVSPVEQFEPVECGVDGLSVAVDWTGAPAGRPIQFTTTIENTGERPCYFNASDLRLHVTSGNQVVYDTTTCQAGIGDKLLLLDTGLATTQALQWNGLNAGDDCSGANAAQPGMYVARVFLGSQELLDSGIVLDLTGGVAGQPEPGDSDDGGAEAENGAEQADGGAENGAEAGNDAGAGDSEQASNGE